MGNTIHNKCVTWSELQVGDFFLNAVYRIPSYGIKIADNTYFDLETNRMYRHVKTKYEMPNYFKCDYEVW